MLRRRLFHLLVPVLVLSMLLAGCAAPAAAPAQPAAEGDAAAGEAMADADNWWAQAAEAAGCSGTTIFGVSESTPPSTYAARDLAAAFEAESGIKVEQELTSWDEMYAKGINDMQAGTGIYDFWLFGTGLRLRRLGQRVADQHHPIAGRQSRASISRFRS